MCQISMHASLAFYSSKTARFGFDAWILLVQSRDSLLREFPRLSAELKAIIASTSKGRRVKLLRLRILNMLSSYRTVTVRMIYYRFVSLFNYPNDRRSEQTHTPDRAWCEALYPTET